MIPLKQFIEHYKCEEVGMRLIAVVNGEKQYVADILDGGYVLSHYGKVLVEQSPPVVEDEPKPKAKRAKTAAVDDDLLAGLE